MILLILLLYKACAIQTHALYNKIIKPETKINMEKIITRFAPSPTGYLHIGGVRTALFNWLYARHNNGKFILRIEDTDAIRSTQESTDAIIDGLRWLGINYDEGPFFQSNRLDIYKEYIQKLLDSGHAYYCDCTPDMLEEKRKKALKENQKPKYDGTCRDKGLKPGHNVVIRFKTPLTGTTIISDDIKGNVSFQNTELDDLVIQKNDGNPTYNFAVVVDDATMGVTNIIRGDDHLNNTPRQINIYEALGLSVPQFAHLPMILGHDRTRLSKRHGATSVTMYKEMGFLPQAIINYLARLGWSHGDQELFTINELIDKFSLKNVGKSAGVFNLEKLEWVNSQHIISTPSETILPHLMPFLKKYSLTVDNKNYIIKGIETLQKRSKTMVEMADAIRFYLVDDIEIDENSGKKFLRSDMLSCMEDIYLKLQKLEKYTKEDLENIFTQTLETHQIKFGKIAQSLRVALTGTTVSPGIFEIIIILDKKRVLKRIKNAIQYIKMTKTS